MVQTGFSYDTPPEQRNWMLPYGLVWLTLETVVIILRIYSRLPGQLGLDDFFIVLAWMLSIANTTLTVILTMHYGLNRHVWDVPSHLWSGAFRLTFWDALVSLISVTCIKISVLLFYRRLVKGVFSKRLRWTMRGAILFIVAYTISFTVFQLIQCTPVSAIWTALDPTYHGPHKCLSPRTIQVGSVVISSISVVTDFITVTLPAILLFTKTSINFTRHQRIALLVIFGVGYLTVVAGIVRTIYLCQAVDSLQWDKTWIGFNAYAAGLAESGLAFLCACAPSLNRLFGKYFRGDSVSDSKYPSATSSQSREKASEKSGSKQRSAQISNVSNAEEEADMRFYGKSFYVDQSSESDVEYVGGLKSESDIHLTTYDAGTSSTIRQEPSLRNSSSIEAGWPLRS